MGSVLACTLQYQHVFMRDAATGKKLLFYAAANAAAFDPAWIPALAANGGANDVIVVSALLLLICACLPFAALDRLLVCLDA